MVVPRSIEVPIAEGDLFRLLLNIENLHRRASCGDMASTSRSYQRFPRAPRVPTLRASLDDSNFTKCRKVVRTPVSMIGRTPTPSIRRSASRIGRAFPFPLRWFSYPPPFFLSFLSSTNSSKCPLRNSVLMATLCWMHSSILCPLSWWNRQ